MTDIAADKAELIALFFETFLYGIFVVLFVQSLSILTSKRSSSKINWPLLVASIAIWAAATGHLVAILARAVQAFINHRNQQGGPVAYYGNLRNALEVTQASFQVAVSLLGDGMAVYRVFVVYDRRYVAIILPIMSLIGTVVTSIASVIIIGKSSTPASALYSPKLETWMPIFFGLTFCTSMICTGLIAIRLWYVSRPVVGHLNSFNRRGREKSRLMLIQHIFIESASMYSAIMFVYLVTYMAKTNYSIVFGDMAAPIIGIAFSSITIRVNRVFNSTTYITQTEQPSTTPVSHLDLKETSFRPNFSVKIPRAVESHGDILSTNASGSNEVYGKKGQPSDPWLAR